MKLNVRVRTRSCFVLGIAVGALGGSAATACSESTDADSRPSLTCGEADAGSAGASSIDPNAEVSLEAVKTCMGAGSSSGACLDDLFRRFLDDHSTAEALALLESYSAQDRTVLVGCHPIAHAIGRGTFAAEGTVDKAFAACNFTCQSGCYHGAMERFLRGDAPSCSGHAHIDLNEVRDRVTRACDPALADTLEFQCLHGLGHALMYFSGYDLEASLGMCDATADAWTQSSCYGGVFMENVVSAMPEMRDLSGTDYHYPCSKLNVQYKDDCYLMQTSRMVEMGLSIAQLFEQCRLAGQFKQTCMISIGRDLSNVARAGDPGYAADQCAIGAGEEREACTRGAVYALVDGTWDGTYALPFCASFPDAEGMNYCFGAAVRYLQTTYRKDAAAIQDECARFVPDNLACSAAAD
jgi:hypothetical protein